MEAKKLSNKAILLMGGALFSMHFGAASMIWPMTWGKESGTSVLIAFLGVFITGVLLPLFAYIALARGEGSFYQISSRISAPFALVFCSLTIIVLGPFYLIPRMSAAAWAGFIQIFSFIPNNMITSIIFSVIYHILVYWFVSNPEKTVDKLSKILLPVLIFIVISIFSKSFITPISTPNEKIYSNNPFAYGFLAGYDTMELSCALIFGVVMINSLRAQGIKEEDINGYLLKIGIIGMSCLTIAHLGHMLIGASTGDLFPQLKYSALYAQVVLELWGSIGGILFSIGLLMAALASATGISSATAEFIAEITKEKINYKKAVTITLILSAIVSNLGLEQIITIITPLLKTVYPPTIVLTLAYSLIPRLKDKKQLLNAAKYSMIASSIWGLFDSFIEYAKLLKVDLGSIIKIHDIFPFAKHGLGFISIAILFFFIGYIFSKKEIHV